MPTQVGTCLTFDLCSVTDDGIFRTAKTRRPIHNNGFVSCIPVAVHMRYDTTSTRGSVGLYCLQVLTIILTPSAMFELRTVCIEVTAVIGSALLSRCLKANSFVECCS